MLVSYWKPVNKKSLCKFENCKCATDQYLKGKNTLPKLLHVPIRLPLPFIQLFALLLLRACSANLPKSMRRLLRRWFVPGESKVSCLIRPENRGVSNSFYYKFSQLTKTSLWFLSFAAFQVTLGLGLAHGVVGLRHLAVHGALPKLGFWCFLHRWHSWRYFIGFPFIKMFTFFKLTH